MSWTAEAQRRAVTHVFTGEREFGLLLDDGTEPGDRNYHRVRARLSRPVHQNGSWRATNETAVEFPPFSRTIEGASVVAVAVYDGPERLATAEVGPVLVAERIEVVLKAGELWVGVAP